MDFNHFGLLAPGDHEYTIDQLKESFLVNGPKDEKLWDKEWRLFLVENLSLMVNQLWKVGITEIYIDGSFVEDKAHPNDIDGYFECDVRDLPTLVRELNILEPDKIWTWDNKSRRPYKGFTKKQLPMWHKYRVELYPHYGQFSGIQDQYGHDLLFPSAFRQTRDTFRPKGIVKIIDS
ncbi:DUF6932 family protein [Siminovitchia fortis]|uniref:Uncharacterized protein n=1 Tax=Siminovitchia fortis TaxID=254758 RepID=A0A443IM85_9BACI|nr:hypothetical protein [Siminovitchia fortis]RWR06239.1 hypothetical protein D4N35_014410 [Siminovitchia fortis]WHY81071.1 hypothetical protein QNH23_14360 [Siminovitchia fortis]